MILPMYVDVSAYIIGAVSKRIWKTAIREVAEDNAEVGRGFT